MKLSYRVARCCQKGRDLIACGVLSAAFTLSSPAFSAQVSIDGASGRVTGLLSAKDVDLLENPAIKTVIFENSLGGTMEAVNAYVELIKRRNLRTEVKGKCFSACALSFLAGITRTTDKTVTSSILFHVARVMDNGKLRPGNRNNVIMSMIDELSGGKMKDPARSKIESSWQEAQGVVFVIGHGFFGERTNTFYCDGSQGTDGSKCALMIHADPYEMGVLTHD